MRVLAISSASRGCAAAIVEQGAVLASFRLMPERGLPEAIPPAIEALLAQAGPAALVAVIVGPGSFTGLRAGIAVAQGVGAGAQVPVIGVAVAEALAEALPDLGGRELWVASAARTGRVFITRGGDVASYGEDDPPAAAGRVAVAGERADHVAAALAARGADVMLTDARLAAPIHVAAIGLRRAAGHIAPLDPVPIYVDMPEAKLPAGGLRPAPR